MINVSLGYSGPVTVECLQEFLEKMEGFFDPQETIITISEDTITIKSEQLLKTGKEFHYEFGDDGFIAERVTP